MKIDQWQTLQRCARMEDPGMIPVALIVDSPWIPGYLGISTLDYLGNPEIWLQANLEVEQRFPDVIFLPGFWAEMGMAAEPSGFGCRMSFYDDRTPLVHPLLDSLGDVDQLHQPDPTSDGLMPFLLNMMRKFEPRIQNAGHVVKIVAGRGPLAVASHLVGMTNFLLGVKLDPANTHRLLRIATQTVRDWLEAQANALTAVEGVMLLDDVVGFLSEKDYLEFAHPYLKEILDAFPGAVKFFHNDMDTTVSFPHLADLGIHIFNFTHLRSLDRVRQLVGPQVCLMGNVPPLDVLARGTPQDVLQAAHTCLKLHPDRRGLILSAGGGVSPGVPGENILALLDAVSQK